MEGSPERSRPSPWWLAGGVALIVAAAWAAGAAIGGPAGPAPTTDPPATDQPSLERIAEAEAFWRALGDGDLDAARGALASGGDAPLIHYTGFTAAFEAGYRPEACRATAADTVRCTLRGGNPALIDLYWLHSATTEYVGSGTVTFGTDGIVGFHEPGLVTTATGRLLGAAVEETGTVPNACDRVHHDAMDLPPFNTRIALTAECAEALLPFLPAAIAAQDG